MPIVIGMRMDYTSGLYQQESFSDHYLLIFNSTGVNTNENKY